MKKYFFTGLVILLPVVFTVLVARLIIRLLTIPFVGIIQTLLLKFDIMSHTAILNHPNVIYGISQFLALILFIFLVYLIGILGGWYAFHYFIRFGEKVFENIPLVNKIYQSCKDVVQSLFYSKQGTFQKVVLVPYPYEGILSVGLVTQEALIQGDGGEENLVSVFVPATPNPTMGFILLYERDRIIFTDMTISQALQLIISCGSKMDEFGIVENK